MQFVFNKGMGVPIKSWCKGIEESAWEQAVNLTNLPFVFKHIALMPDAHHGYGMPIGGVMATIGVVVPNAVGVDIGCGVCALRTSLKHIDYDHLKTIMSRIRCKVPVGRKHHTDEQNERRMPNNNIDELLIVRQEYNSALRQVGTLGGGNHFIEIQKGNDGYIWLMVHSGSRNLGFKVANHYNKVAKRLNKSWYSSIPEDFGMAFLPLTSAVGKAYIQEMWYCVDFALANRALIMDRIVSSIESVMNVSRHTWDDMINIPHNYANMEQHFGRNVLVHRKGAIKADAMTYGIVPGSQGTSSFIVKGAGNSDSFRSCSHGAGRVLGRKQAQRELSLNAEKKRLDDLNVIHSIRNISDLDEAPSAYKDINKVMENQHDLVSIEVELKPLAVIKG